MQKLLPNKRLFDITDVLNSICDKLISRHPHIYGDVKVNNEEDVKRNWEQLKMKEGKKSVLEGVPQSLPSMVKAMRIQEKARGAGFDWDEKQQVWNKVMEELDEFKAASETADQKLMESEFGDLIFSLINYSRFVDINPEEALERTNKKFISRFRYLEDKTKEQGRKLNEMTLEEMDKIWDEAKSKE